MDIFADIANFLIDQIVAIMEWFINLLPDSPFIWMQSTENPIIQAGNALFPLAEALVHMQVFVLACGTWYAIRVVARWTKLAA